MIQPNNCESSYKKALQKLQTAKNWAEDADDYLNSGSAINWVCDKMSSALLWAMEAWLFTRIT